MGAFAPKLRFQGRLVPLAARFLPSGAMRALAYQAPQLQRLPNSCAVPMSRHGNLLPAESLHAEPLLLLLACWQPLVALTSTSTAKQQHEQIAGW